MSIRPILFYERVSDRSNHFSFTFKTQAWVDPLHSNSILGSCNLFQYVGLGKDFETRINLIDFIGSALIEGLMLTNCRYQRRSSSGLSNAESAVQQVIPFSNKLIDVTTTGDPTYLRKYSSRRSKENPVPFPRKTSFSI